jgi:hypothetical protein
MQVELHYPEDLTRLRQQSRQQRGERPANPSLHGGAPAILYLP